MFMDEKEEQCRQRDCYAEIIYKDSGSDEITGWKAMIVDGAIDMSVKDGDDLRLTLEDRIQTRKVAQKPGERGMDRHPYAMLMLEALRKGEPIDNFDNGYRCTLLDCDPANSETRAPYAFWDPGFRRVHFDWHRPGSPEVHTRFRSVVGGDVEL